MYTICCPKLYRYAFSCLSLAACLLAIAGCGPPPASRSELLLPQWASLRLEETKFYQTYMPDLQHNPVYLTADFDGDGSLDIALSTISKAKGESTIVLLTQAKPDIKTIILTEPFSAWKLEERLPAGAALPHKGPVIILYPASDQEAGWLYHDGQQWQHDDPATK